MTLTIFLLESEDFLITERGELILGNQSDFVSGDFTDPDFSGLLTQAGQVLITQNDRVIGTEQLFETASVAVQNNSNHSRQTSFNNSRRVSANN